MIADLMFLIVALQQLQGLQHFPGFSLTWDLFLTRIRASAVTAVTPVHAGASSRSTRQAGQVNER